MDVLVIGAGPSGLAASAALAREGLQVGCMSPEHPAPWPNNYALWEDEIVGLGVEDCFECRWEHPIAYTGDEGRRDLDRVYLRLDNDKLRGRLIEWCEHGDVEFIEAMGESMLPDERGVTVVDGEGGEHRAALLVDATGHRPQFVEREAATSIAFQAAYGFIGEFDSRPMEPEVVLMDFREDFRESGDARGPAPTFLYAMQLDEGRFFVEETSLVHRPALTFDVLEDRLAQRIRARGVNVLSVDEAERCLIPMNSPMPLLDQQVVGFGGAASMVHPATGYQMARVLRTAPELASAIAEALGEADASPAEASRRAWRAVWPEEMVRARKLWLFGMETLLAFDARQTRQFFDAFFSLPDEQWQGYMSGTIGPTEIAQVMWTLFKGAPMSLRLALAQSAMGKEGWQMIKALANR